MNRLEDDALIDELRERFDENRRALSDLRVLTGKLESINRKLHDAERLKSHFLSNIRNEINNPLTAIMGFAYQLKTGPVSAEQAVRNGRLIYDEAFELSFQLENIFMAAGLEAGQEAPLPVPVDVAVIINEGVAELEHRIFEKGIEVRHTHPDTLPLVVDPRFLQVILRNLIANAVEFSPRWGVVGISVGDAGETLRIAVSDSGPGVDPADHETVFDRFRQLDSGSCKKHRGHGLGLSICRELAGLCGGAIGIESTPGSGSVFTLTLPTGVLSADPFHDGAVFSPAAEETF